MTISELIKALTELQELTGPDVPFSIIHYDADEPLESWCVAETYSEEGDFTVADGVALFID